MENKTQTLGDKFAQHLKKHSISQATLVKDLNLSKVHISCVLNNKRDISEQLRVKLNAYLDTDY